MLLIRSTISSTKKFLNRTFQSFKSLLTGAGGGSSGHYQKLPKISSTTFNNFSTYDRVVAADDHLKTNNKMVKEPTMRRDQEVYDEGFKKFTKQIIVSPIQNRGLDDDHDDNDDEIFERKREFVKEKLKEMVLMDLINVEHVKKDIEEVLYYYSHITCPVYVEIVNKFFMEMYSEFFIHQQT